MNLGEDESHDEQQRHANPQALVRNSLKLKYIVHLSLIICCLNRSITIPAGPRELTGHQKRLCTYAQCSAFPGVCYQHPQSVIARTSLIKKHCHCLSLNISVPFYQCHSLITCAPRFVSRWQICSDSSRSPRSATPPPAPS